MAIDDTKSQEAFGNQPMNFTEDELKVLMSTLYNSNDENNKWVPYFICKSFKHFFRLKFSSLDPKNINSGNSNLYSLILEAFGDIRKHKEKLIHGKTNVQHNFDPVNPEDIFSSLIKNEVNQGNNGQFQKSNEIFVSNM